MLVVNIFEAKARLSEFLDAVARGDRVVICKRNQPIAELRAVDRKRSEPRPIGGGPHTFAVPDAFNDPLPASIIAEYEQGEIFPRAGAAMGRRPRVAEATVKYHRKRRR